MAPSLTASVATITEAELVEIERRAVALDARAAVHAGEAQARADEADIAGKSHLRLRMEREAVDWEDVHDLSDVVSRLVEMIRFRSEGT